MAKQRLDRWMVENGAVESREKAQALIMAGEVLLNGQKAAKPGQSVDADAKLEVLARPPYVSRGGLKLAAARPSVASSTRFNQISFQKIRQLAWHPP